MLFRGGPDQKVRKELLEQFKVHTILSLPAGCFLPYTGSAKNPNTVDDYEHRPALELVQSIKTKEARIAELLDELESLLERAE